MESALVGGGLLMLATGFIASQSRSGQIQTENAQLRQENLGLRNALDKNT